jgi:hypothetical protein
MATTTFLGYKEQVAKRLSDLDFYQQLFFSTWITEYLFRKYGEDLNEQFQEEEDLDLEEVLNFLWNVVNKRPADIDEDLVSDYMEKLENEDIYDELDEEEEEGAGQSSLISGFYNSLMFLRDKDQKLLTGAASLPLNIIDTILVNELGMKDSDDMLSHPLYQKEFSVQDSMLDYLHSGKPAGSAQKDLFREK